MKLLGDRILIKKDKTNYTGKIILLENNDMHPYTGEIVAIGNQVKSKKYNIGDHIAFVDTIFELTTIMEKEDKDNIYIFIKENDICCKIINKPNHI